MCTIIAALGMLCLLMQCRVSRQQCSGGVLIGRVFWSEGNFMPSPTGNRHSERVPVERVVVVHELTGADAALKSDGSLYSRVPTKRIASTTSAEDGRFSVCLAPGQYSVFTVEDDGLFANRLDGLGNIQPVTIHTNDTTRIVIDINYKAYY